MRSLDFPTKNMSVDDRVLILLVRRGIFGLVVSSSADSSSAIELIDEDYCEAIVKNIFRTTCIAYQVSLVQV